MARVAGGDPARPPPRFSTHGGPLAVTAALDEAGQGGEVGHTQVTQALHTTRGPAWPSTAPRGPCLCLLRTRPGRCRREGDGDPDPLGTPRTDHAAVIIPLPPQPKMHTSRQPRALKVTTGFTHDVGRRPRWCRGVISTSRGRRCRLPLGHAHPGPTMLLSPNRGLPRKHGGATRPDGGVRTEPWVSLLCTRLSCYSHRRHSRTPPRATRRLRSSKSPSQGHLVALTYTETKYKIQRGYYSLSYSRQGSTFHGMSPA